MNFLFLFFLFLFLVDKPVVDRGAVLCFSKLMKEDSVIPKKEDSFKIDFESLNQNQMRVVGLIGERKHIIGFLSQNNIIHQKLYVFIIIIIIIVIILLFFH